MLSLGYKAEIQALSSISFEFLTATYLPVKIKHGKWIWRFIEPLVVDKINIKEKE